MKPPGHRELDPSGTGLDILAASVPGALLYWVRHREERNCFRAWPDCCTMCAGLQWDATKPSGW